jgi:hypothetical protein
LGGTPMDMLALGRAPTDQPFLTVMGTGIGKMRDLQ